MKSLTKISLLLIAVSTLIVNNSNAQLYVKAGLGYAMPTASGVITTYNPSSTSEKNLYGSFGKGLKAGIGVGYMLNSRLGVELNIAYGSSKITAKSDYGSGNTEEITAKSSGIALMPAIVLVGGKDGAKTAPYVRAGLRVPVIGKTTTDDKIVIGATTSEYTMETKPGLSVGFTGALGVMHQLTKKISLWGEINAVAASSKAKSSSITKYSVNGVDKLSTLPTILKETNYVDELTSSSNNSQYNSSVTTSKAGDELATVTPSSNVGIAVGIVYFFNKK